MLERVTKEATGPGMTIGSLAKATLEPGRVVVVTGFVVVVAGFVVVVTGLVVVVDPPGFVVVVAPAMVVVVAGLVVVVTGFVVVVTGFVVVVTGFVVVVTRRWAGSAAGWSRDGDATGRRGHERYRVSARPTELHYLDRALRRAIRDRRRETVDQDARQSVGRA